jgi:zinc/manganese transport system substrate-binding protein
MRGIRPRTASGRFPALSTRPAWLVCAGSLLSIALAATGCSTASSQASQGGRVITVVAAENFWGSIASQVGGSHVKVYSIITNPTTDPHTYEPTAANARTIASARLVIENGAGYDPWVGRLVAADQGQRISLLNVASALGVATGGNPHRWYNPGNVKAIVNRLAAAYGKLDPADKSYFAKRRALFLSSGLRRYNELISAIKAKYGGTPVGASESIFAMLAPALGLKLITPPTFLRAISEGTEVSAADKKTIDNQITHHLIKIYVYNSQNVTPDVRAQLTAVKAAHIPIATITETLSPPTATFQAWQIRQLQGIEIALAKATGH